jgi:hypothetical protein
MDLPVKDEIRELFPNTHNVQYVEFDDTPGEEVTPSPLRIGVVLSGG